MFLLFTQVNGCSTVGRCNRGGCGKPFIQGKNTDPNGWFRGRRLEDLLLERRLEDLLLDADDLEVRDPLCEWVLNDGLDTNWTMLSNDNLEKEEEQLLRECEETFENPEDLAQCKFYIYAMTAYYAEDIIVNELKFDPEVEDTAGAYKKCGKVTVGLNDAIEDGELSGVKIVEQDGEDYFELDDPVDVTDELAVSAAVSIGSMISAFVGATLVKVCRDFHPTDYSWLL